MEILLKSTWTLGIFANSSGRFADCEAQQRPPAFSLGKHLGSWCSSQPGPGCTLWSRSPLPAQTVYDFMIHQLCCQKSFSQGEWVSGTDRWRPRDLGSTALAVMARQQEPNPQGCILNPASYLPSGPDPDYWQAETRKQQKKKVS